MNRKIEVDPSAGYCFGVENAIETAERNLEKGQLVYGLGSLVHNDEEIKRLNDLGLKTISLEDLSVIKEGSVIFRAHGEPPSTYELASEQGLEIIDATCPIVLKLQKKIRKIYLGMDHAKEQIVIFGKAGHPESLSLMGQTDNRAVLVTAPMELEEVDPWKNIYLFSQTTMDPEQYEILEATLRMITKVSSGIPLVSNCSICKQMKRRKPDLKQFALKHEIMIFVSGKNSSNGKMLFDFCRSLNSNSYWIENPAEIKSVWFSEKGSVGITGATSTSVWQLEKVKKHIESLIIG